MARNRKRRRRLLILAASALLLGIVVLGSDLWVRKSTAARLYSDAEAIPHNKVGLLLGTSKFLGDGSINLYYRYRLDAAVELFKAGKIDYILVSGDNGSSSYNEPETFQADLIAAGVPADRIVLDYAGFRTLDSVVRCLAVFGEKNITVISQPFHNERALFIADHRGISAVGYNAKDIRGKWGLKVQAREKLARVKLMLDLLVGKEPKFLGRKIVIG